MMDRLLNYFLRMQRASHRLAQKLAFFHRHESGVSAVEFALLLPVMVLIYIGVADLARGVEANRKVNRVASVVGDLVSRQISVQPVQLDDIFNVGKTIMFPSQAAPAIKITFLQLEKTNNANQFNARVVWSRSTGSLVADKPKTILQIPSDLRMELVNYIRVEAQYNYIPLTNYVIPTIPMSEVYYISPRYTNIIPCTGCPT
jgi:Flp pilus assembly protein TadG